METNFKDLSAEQLLNHLVIYESGKSYSGTSKRITKISKITATGFRIRKKLNEDESLDCLFDFNGHQKGLHRRMDVGTISKCYLITEEEAVKISNEWKEKREVKEMQKELAELLPTLTHEKLKSILDIIR